MVKIQSLTSKLFFENGDRLSRSEFERRSALMPNVKKSELIEGVVHMAAALRYQSHGRPHGMIMTWLGVYTAATPGVELADNATVRLDKNNEPQPDVLLRIDRSKGGQSIVAEDDYLEGAPELIVEIAASSEAYDLYEKKEVYRRNGVQEYIVWQVLDLKISWFSLQEGLYVELLSDTQGNIASVVFPGLVLGVEAMLSQNLALVLGILQGSMNTAEHQGLIDHLR